jgi:Glycosyl transferase family 2
MKIEFIISSHKNTNNLRMILSSLMAQTNPNWVCQVYADGVYDGYEKIKSIFKEDERFTFYEIDGPNSDFGNTPRNIALKKLTQEWVVMSGDDNYYTPVFVDEFLNAVDNENVHFVYCDMLHNHYGYFGHMKSSPSVGYIDIGNFMTRSKFASQKQIHAKSTIGDGLFVEEYLQEFPGEKRYIPKVLYVHN